MDKSNLAVSTYNKVAEKYTDQYFSDKTDIPLIDKFLSFLPKKATILDVGCGPGQHTNYMIEKGFNVEGIDLSKEMIRIAKKKVPEGIFSIKDIRNLSFSDNSFDGLLAAYSLIHIPTKELHLTLRGFYRVLKPKGYMLLIVQKGKSDQIVDEPLKEGEKTFINFFTKKRLSNYLSDVGFSIVDMIEKPSSDPDDLSDTVIYAIAKAG